MSRFSTDAAVAKIIRGRRAFTIIPWPGRLPDDVPEEQRPRLAVRLLSERELEAAQMAGRGRLDAWAKKRSLDPESLSQTHSMLVERWTQREIVFCAFHDCETVTPNPEKATRYFETPGEVDDLDADTLSMLFDAYMHHAREVNPTRYDLSDEELKALTEALGKEHGAAAHLAGLAPSTLARLCISLASRLRST